MTNPSGQDDALSDFERRLAAKEAELAAKRSTNQSIPAQSGPSEPVFDADLIPEIPESSLSSFDQTLNEATEKLGIVEAYNRFCGKTSAGDIIGQTRGGRKTEGIKVSCPNPAHPDRNPSAWMNTEKGTIFCGGCSMGWDAKDLAAYFFGYSVPGYKARGNTQYREVMLKLGQVLGVKEPDKPVEYVPEGQETSEVNQLPAQREPAQGDETLATVHKLPSAHAAEVQEERAAAEQAISDSLTIDWRDTVPENTFLRTWLDETCKDTSPEEYHFWTGLMAIGFAVGRNRTLTDYRPVIPNLFVCLVGPSGAGKSTAKAHLQKLVQEAFPYDPSNPLSQGTKFISSPGSAEYVVKALSAPVADPADPKKIMFHAPVRAQVDFEELAALVNLSKRVGSSLKPVLLELYDASTIVGSGSLTHGERQAHNPFVQVTTTTQNGSLHGLLDKSDEISGFMNRWIFAGGRLKRQRSLGGVVLDLKPSVQRLQEIYRWAGTTKGMALSPDAYAAWDEFFHQTLVPLKAISETKGSAMLNRLDLLFKKLMVLFACNSLHSQVEVSDVELAKSLLPYLLKSFGVVTDQMQQNPDNDLFQRIMARIRSLTTVHTIKLSDKVIERPFGPAAREILNGIKTNELGSVADLSRVLSQMKNLGLVMEEEILKSPKGGRAKKTWTEIA